MDKNNQIAPVVKWVGGKRQILGDILKVIPRDFSTYYEPFFGGGAVLFALQPDKAVVNDINSELVNVYRVIKENVDELIKDLSRHKDNREYFYQIRELDRDKNRYHQLLPVEKASRLIYLNKTCYNGLYRVNQLGEFNVPYGYYKKPNIVNEPVLRTVSNYFNRADISFFCMDFEKAMKNIGTEAFVYLDPPYDPISTTSSFTGYDKDGFNRAEQIRLKRVCDQLNQKGIRFLLSNSATEYILDLYKEYKVEIVKAKRAINSNPQKRGEIDEVLVRNYE